MKKRHKNVEGEAVNRVNKHKQDLKNKILQANLDASDFSEVETVNAAGQFFQLDLNFESLKDYLMSLRKLIQFQSGQINKLDADIQTRSTQVVMGKSLERIAMGVSRKLGDRPHAFKLDDPTFLVEETLDDNGRALKTGVEKVVEKMEIISKQIIN